MARRFLPALRGLTSSPESGLLVPEASEAKTLSVGGYSSMTRVAGMAGAGMEDRAAGWDMDTAVTEGYERVVWVYRCIELMAGHASRLPFVIGRNVGEDDEELLENHPLYRVMNKRANPHETGRQFRKRLSAQLLLSKRGAFVEVTKSRAGFITRLDLLDPSRVRPVADPHGDYVLYFEFTRRDGQVREIDPERIRWIREPHPTDPFSGTTPLEAAGMSVQLDFLSRLYNVSFIANDSRPGGIVGVDTDTLSDQEMDRIERKFKPGAQHAGEMTVIGTGAGGIHYVDTTTKPRDMAYGEASQNAKDEVLSAFGIGESVLGNASGRTFDNAEQELYNFWTQPMPPHLELIAGAFDQDVDEEWDPFFDTSKIEALELPRRRDRDEARKEVEQGLRSIDEYRPLAHLEPKNTPQSRALWISPAKAPIAGQPGDEAALGLSDPNAPQGPDGGMPPTGPGGGMPPTDPNAPASDTPAADAVAAARADDPTADGPAAAAVAHARAGSDTSTPVEGAAADAVAHARLEDASVVNPSDAGTLAVQQARLEGKSLAEAPSTDAVEYDAGPTAAAQTEIAVGGALEALLARQQGVVTARIVSPKWRKGTKFWQADSPDDTRGGDGELDTSRIVDSERWQQETVDTLTPIVDQSASDAGVGLLTALAAGGVLANLGPDDTDMAYIVGRATAGPAMLAVAVAAKAVGDLMNDLAETLRVEALVAPDTDSLVAKAKAFYAEKAHQFATSLGTSVAHAAVNGARDATAAALVPMPDPSGQAVAIVRTWISQRDQRVRPAHAAADGTSLPVGEPFVMDGSPVRYPQDPMAPPSLTRGCRCRLSYRVAANARLLSPPVPAATA